MPYEIIKSKMKGPRGGIHEGYRVREVPASQHKPPFYLSKKPLTLEKAKKQKIAVILSELKRKK
jgi:hypothetical protein